MRYIRLLGIFYRYSILRELEYRVNFLTNAFMSLFWMAWSIFGATIFFQHRDHLGDWSFNQVLIVIGLFSMFTGVIEAFFRPNVAAIIEQIRDGTFDFVLTKPVNSQFIASLRQVVVWRIFDIIAGFAIIGYALNQLGVTPTLAQIAIFVVMLLCAAVMVYSLWMVMVTFAFWFIKVDNLTELFWSLYEAGRFPISVYQGWLRAFLTFVIPLAFITTFPASALLGRPETELLPIALILAVVLFVFSNLFWNFAIRSYSSASS